MKYIKNIDNYKLYEFKPHIYDLFSKYYPEKITLRRVIRFFLAFSTGYKIYYLRYKDKTVAYCVVQNGKTDRFDFATEKDIIIGPYLVVEEFRNRAIASKLVKNVLELEKYDRAFDYIKKDNIASIKVSERAGMNVFAEAISVGIKCDIRLAKQNTQYYIMMKKV